MMLLLEGLLFSSLALILMLIFEFGISHRDVQRFRKRDGGKELHAAGMRATIINHMVLGPVAYDLTLRHCCTRRGLTIMQQARCVVVFLLIENSLYYVAHYMMHTRKLYWMHRFHHKFNSIVLPSSASAVSTAEFAIAYMLPFYIGAWGASCDKASALMAASLVTVFNLIIHTPVLDENFTGSYPWIFVSPGDHLAHHRQLSGNYSAPIFHFERIISTFRNSVVGK
jgi:sterol desaturase/sphingolipid hydroxylase (fatty acid hydroxylase superfamily)